jgi:hypothetical protein
VGVALRRRHPGMAKNLLHDANVHSLFNQQSRSGVPGIVDSCIADLRLGEDGLPGPPVLGAFDRAAAPGGEDQVMVCPRAACPQPLRSLLLRCSFNSSRSGRALESELAFALAVAGTRRHPRRGLGTCRRGWCSLAGKGACSRRGPFSCSPVCRTGDADAFCTSACKDADATVQRRRVARCSHAAIRCAEFGTRPGSHRFPGSHTPSGAQEPRLGGCLAQARLVLGATLGR